MYATHVIAVVSLFIAVVLCQAPPAKPVWPTQFSAPFGLNYHGKTYSIVNASSTMYYRFDNVVQAQLIDYPEFCIPGLAPNSELYPCKLYFNNTGIFYVSPVNNIDCCTVTLGVGAVPPDFLEGFSYKDNQTADDIWGNSHACYHWVGSLLTDSSFGYWTNIVADSEFIAGADIQFKDGPTGVYWNFAPLIVAPQDPSLFTPPAVCASSCTSSAVGARLVSILRHRFDNSQ